MISEYTLPVLRLLTPSLWSSRAQGNPGIERTLSGNLLPEATAQI